MIGRLVKLGLEAVAALAAIAVAVAGVGVWRLSQGPVDLDGLAPRVETALTRLAPDMRVSVGGTALAWGGWPDTVVLHLREVRAALAGKTVELPELDVRFSVAALLRGTLAPVRISARDAHLSIVRGTDRLRPGAPGEAPSPAAVAARALDDLMAAPAPDRPGSYLRRVTLARTTVRVHDRRLNRAWRFNAAQLRVRRTADGVRADADGVAVLKGGRVPLTVRAGYDRGGDAVRLTARTEGVHASDIARVVPGVRLPARITAPLTIRARTTMGLDGALGPVRAEIEAGSGRVHWRRLPKPLAIDGVRGRVRWAPGSDGAALERLSLAIADGPTITGAARIEGLTGRPRTIAADLTAHEVRLNALERYWPTGAARNTRTWITNNLRAGTVNRASVAMRLRLPGADGFPVGVEKLEGKLAYEDVTVHYFRPLPPVTGVGGEATFNRERMTIGARGGSLGPTAVRDGEIKITGLDKKDQDIAIDVTTEGPLDNALSVLNHPRLGLIDDLGLRPSGVRGEARADLHFAFPLLEDLTLNQLTAEADGELTAVEADDFVLGQDAANGRFDLALDTEGMRLTGPVELAGAPLELHWREDFREDAEVPTRMHAEVRELPAAALDRLGLATGPYLGGELAGTVTATHRADGTRVIDIDADLAAAALELPAAAWRKPPGTPGTATATLAVRDGTLTAVRKLRVRTTGENGAALDRAGRAAFAQGRLHDLAFDRLTLGATALSGVRVRRRDNALAARIRGGTLDARPWLGALGEALTTAETGGGGVLPDQQLTLSAASLDRVILGDDRALTRVGVNARRRGDGRWTAVRMSGRVPARHNRTGDRPVPLTLSYGPKPDGRQRLRIETGNLGAALRGLDVLDGLEGGALRIAGTSRGPDTLRPMDGTLSIEGVTVRRVSPFARLLTLASLSGLVEAMQGEGLRFETINGELTYSGRTLGVRELHAYGPSLGITSAGTVRLDANGLDLQGALVPAAGLNRVLGSIPLLGRLLTGGEGGGVVAMRYGVRGSLDDPEISVNPLSALTPGALRGIFGLMDTVDQPPGAWPGDS